MQRRAFLERLRSHSARGETQPEVLATPGLPELRLLSSQERIDLFLVRLSEIGVVAHLVASLPDAKEAVERLLRERAWGSVACAPGLSWQGIAEQWTVEAREAAMGLSEAEWAAAETGTVVVKTSADERRGYSLLPPAIGVIVREGRLRDTLGDVLREIASKEGPLPSCLSFISGPSNTADVASVHVVGVHGPREVFVWVIADGPASGGDRGSRRHDE